MGPLIQALTDALTEGLATRKPFAFFGHSLGALIAFELTRELRRRSGPIPIELFVSGSSPPHQPYPHHIIHNLPEDELLEELRQLGGTPPEILQHKELMALLLPALRADFAVRETYVYQEGAPLSCPITAFGGLSDPWYSRESLEDWRTHTTSAFSSHMLPGDHFFLTESQSAILEVISRRLVR
jgi:medium-chain acyl-[acyl-carrier-protein] hydrolase